MNIGNAFTYFFKDNNWIKKLLIGGALLLPVEIGNVLNQTLQSVKSSPTAMQDMGLVIIAAFIFAITGVITSLFVTGYFAVNTNLRIYKKDAILPEWSNWKNLFLSGFKVFGGSFLYGVLYTILLLISFIILGGLTGALAGKNAEFLILTVLSVILFFITLLFASAATIAFLTNLKFSSFFNFKLISAIVKKNTVKYIIFLASSAVLYGLAGLLGFLLLKTIVLAIFIPFINMYICFVISEIMAQVVREESKE